ncbi:hypothetical protein L1049_025297 [Liquidambar formosana]|uniref:FCP1 homology domain-containing protein n=1 Tax=Liquidambar formosana TaxID=63359 RepID=A0AAP0R410_LIQFO
MKNSSLERLQVESSLNSDLDLGKYDAKSKAKATPFKEKKKRKRNKHNNRRRNDVNYDLQDGTLLKKSDTVASDTFVQPPVNICYKKDSVAECNSEVGLSQEKDKGKENKKKYNAKPNAGMSLSRKKNKEKEDNRSYSALENNDIDHDIQEAGDTLSPDITSNKHIQKDDLSSVSGVAELESTRLKKNYEVLKVNSLNAEKFSSFSKSSDACPKRNDHAEADDSHENLTRRRRRKKASDSLGNSLEPIMEDDTSSSKHAVQSSSTKDTYFDCSGEGTTMQVLEDISIEEPPVNCSDGKPAARESKKRMKVKNVKETSKEDGFVKDASVINIAEEHEHFEQAIKGKVDMIQISVQDGIHVEEHIDESIMRCKGKVPDDLSGCDPSRKHLEQKNVETEMKTEEINPSSLHLGAIKDDVDLVGINNEDNSPLVSHSSPERALIGHSRKKLLILDVNGLLADIVPYVPDGYKPDITISKKAGRH